MILANYFTYLWILGMLCCLSACGFHPVYYNPQDSIATSDSTHSTTSGTVYSFLQKIDISPINSIEGAEFYNHFKNILPVTKDPVFSLDCHLVITQRQSVIQKNSDVLMEVTAAQVTYTLISKKSGKVITSGSFSRDSAYSIPSSPYHHEIKKQDISKDVAIALAEEMRNRIILYYRNNPNAENL